MDFKLDIMNKGYNIWPTWLIFSTPVTHVRELQVDIRLFGYLEIGQFRRNGGMGPLWKPLFQLLDRLLHYGPHLVWDPFDAKPLVDLLTIHVSRGEEQLVGDDVDDMYAPSDRNMRRVFRTVWSEISLFAEPGALHRKVSRINIC